MISEENKRIYRRLADENLLSIRLKMSKPHCVNQEEQQDIQKSVKSVQAMDNTENSSMETLTRMQQNMVTTVDLLGIPIIALLIDGQERLCLAQISNTLLKQYSYNEVHNRRVALGINCVQCTPVQLEILRRTGAMPVSSRRCGMITKKEAERLCKSFLTECPPPQLPDGFFFSVAHKCAWGCKGM
uniref:SKI/SNO/DAC domain-containing protein n=1 Tax=Romanomermis culicivorax TaxID=13658 RepID=A0A915IKA0_ROMCU